MSTESVLQLRDVRFGYEAGPILIDMERFDIGKGESVFLRGPSGSGKSTLLGLIGGVLTPNAGTVSICHKDITDISSARRDQIRADHLGIIFQQFNLLPYLSNGGCAKSSFSTWPVQCASEPSGGRTQRGTATTRGCCTRAHRGA